MVLKARPTRSAAKRSRGRRAILAVLAALLAGWPLAARAVTAATKEAPELRAVPVEAYAKYCAGLELSLKGESADAEAVLEEALQLDPDSSQVHLALAQVLRLIDHHTEALQHLQEAAKLAPQDPLTLWELGYQYLLASDRDKATEYLEKAVEQDPENLKMRQELANIYLRPPFRDTKAAIRHWEGALKTRVVSNNAAFTAALTEHIAAAYQRLGETDKAIEWYRKALPLSPNRSAIRAEIGELLAGRGDVEGAVEEYLNGLEEQPGFLPLRYDLAEGYLKLQQWEKAYDQLKLYVGKAGQEKRKAAALLTLIRLADRMGKADEAATYRQQAIELLRALVQTQPNVNFFAQLGVLLVDEKQYDEAVSFLRKAAELSSGEDAIRYRRAIAETLGQAQKLDEAEAEYREIVAATRASDSSLLELARFQNKRGRPDDAIRTLQDNLGGEAGGRTALFCVTLASYLDEAQRYDEAVATLRKALDLADTASVLPIRHAIAQSLEKAKKLPEAEAEYRKLLTDFPTSDQAALILAGFLKRQKRTEEAIESLRKSLESVGNDRAIPLYLTMANYYSALGQHEAAEEQLKAAMLLDPENPLVNNHLGYVYAQRGIHLDQAVELVQKALAVDPDNGAYLDSLAWAYFRLGRFQEARTEMDKALKALQNDADAVVHDHCGDILWALGEKDAAIQQWKLALPGVAEASEELDPEVLKRKIEQGPAESPKPPASPPQEPAPEPPLPKHEAQ